MIFFQASNNQVVYETSIAWMILEKEMGVTELMAKSDSSHVIGQVSGKFQGKDPHLAKYLQFVKTKDVKKSVPASIYR